MGKVFLGDILGKEIVNVEGAVLGKLDNVIFEEQSGKMIDMVVKPDSDINRLKYRESGRFILIPFSHLVSVKDYILIDENKALKQ